MFSQMWFFWSKVNIGQYSLPPEKNNSLPPFYPQSDFHHDAKSHYFMLVVFLCANYHHGGLRNWCFNLNLGVIQDSKNLSFIVPDPSCVWTWCLVCVLETVEYRACWAQRSWEQQHVWAEQFFGRRQHIIYTGSSKTLVFPHLIIMH